MGPRSEDITDTTSSRYFLRTVATPLSEARAMTSLIKTFGWTYISIVHSNGSESMEKVNLLINELHMRSICVARTENIGPPAEASAEAEAGDNVDSRMARHKTALNKLHDAAGAIGVVAIMSIDDFQMLILSLEELGKYR